MYVRAKESRGKKFSPYFKSDLRVLNAHTNTHLHSQVCEYCTQQAVALPNNVHRCRMLILQIYRKIYANISIIRIIRDKCVQKFFSSALFFRKMKRQKQYVQTNWFRAVHFLLFKELLNVHAFVPIPKLFHVFGHVEQIACWRQMLQFFQ